MTAPSQTDESVLEQFRQGTLTSGEIIALLKQYGLHTPLVREMTIDAAIASVELTAEESFQAYQQFYQKHQLESESERQAWLETHGLTPNQLEYVAKREMKLERFKQEQWANKLESHFLQRKAKLDRVVYSLIRVKETGLAQELYFRIQEGEQSFSELAAAYSQGPEAQTGGLVGPVELRIPHPLLAKVLMASQPGHLTPPVPVGDWFVIVQLEQFLPAQLDGSMRQRLLTDLFEEWIQERMKHANDPNPPSISSPNRSV